MHAVMVAGSPTGEPVILEVDPRLYARARERAR